MNFGHKSLSGAPASPPSWREEILEIPHSKPRTFSWRAGNLGQLSVLAGGPQFTPLQNGEHWPPPLRLCVERTSPGALRSPRRGVYRSNGIVVSDYRS